MAQHLLIIIRSGGAKRERLEGGDRQMGEGGQEEGRKEAKEEETISHDRPTALPGDWDSLLDHSCKHGA